MKLISRLSGTLVGVVIVVLAMLLAPPSIRATSAGAADSTSMKSFTFDVPPGQAVFIARQLPRGSAHPGAGEQGRGKPVDPLLMVRGADREQAGTVELAYSSPERFQATNPDAGVFVSLTMKVVEADGASELRGRLLVPKDAGATDPVLQRLPLHLPGLTDVYLLPYARVDSQDLLFVVIVGDPEAMKAVVEIGEGSNPKFNWDDWGIDLGE
ncbi:MAG: hypothetical protein ACLFV3_10510 [Phycisphaeraceae bacterium]